MSSENKSSIKICFIGAPGSGKSTIFKALSESRGKHFPWLTSDEAKVEIAKSGKFIEDGLLSWKQILRIFLNSGLLKGREGSLADLILKKRAEVIFQQRRSEYSILFDIAFRGLEKEVADPVSRMLASAFFVKTAKEEILIDSHYHGGMVLFDDSMWQSLRGVKKYFSNSPVNNIRRLPVPDAVIYCSSGVDNIFSRIKLRERSGKVNTCHYALSDKELKRSIRTDTVNARFKANLLQRSGVEVLNINTESDLSLNVRLVKEFLINRIT